MGDRSVLIALVGRTVDDNSGLIFRYMSVGTEILKIQIGGVDHKKTTQIYRRRP